MAVTQSTPAITPEFVPEPWQFEHADRVERDLLGHAVRRSADRAGDVGAVAVAVVRALAVADEIGAVAHPAGELLVGRADARVDDVGVDACSGLVVVVGVVQRQVALVDPVEPPRRGRLRGDGVDDLVRLDVRDAGCAASCGGLGGRQPDGEALERVLVDVLDAAAVRPRELPGRTATAAAATRLGVARTALDLKTTMYEPATGSLAARTSPAADAAAAAKQTNSTTRRSLITSLRLKVLDGGSKRHRGRSCLDVWLASQERLTANGR